MRRTDRRAVANTANALRRHHDPYWTPEREFFLGLMDAAGVPPREIAAALGGGCTVGMVAGKLHRTRTRKQRAALRRALARTAGQARA